MCKFYFREKKLSRRSSLKVLDYSMQGVEGTENCSKFIEFLGLRSLFPLYMKVRNQLLNNIVSIKQVYALRMKSFRRKDSLSYIRNQKNLKKSKLERDLKSCPLRCRFSALPTELSRQLGATVSVT